MSRLPLGLSGGAVALPGSPAPADEQGWQKTGVFRSTAQALVRADGTATVAFPPLDTNQRWQISRMTISCAGTIDPAPAVQLLAVAGSVEVLLSGTTCGLFDEADYNAEDGLVILPGETLQVIWTGAPVGAEATATAQYELYTQAS